MPSQGHAEGEGALHGVTVVFLHEDLPGRRLPRQTLVREALCTRERWREDLELSEVVVLPSLVVEEVCAMITKPEHAIVEHPADFCT